MANHCIEVTCCNCGAAYCLLGCNYDNGTKPYYLAPIAEQEKAKLEEVCKYCGLRELILD